MKKIITLLVSVTMVGAVFAQYDKGWNQGNNGYGGGYDKGKDITVNIGFGKDKDVYYFSPAERDMQIASINRETDRQIKSVKMKFFMPRFRKDQLIFKLEQDRQDQIQAVYAKFNSRKNLFNGGPKRHW